MGNIPRGLSRRSSYPHTRNAEEIFAEFLKRTLRRFFATRRPTKDAIERAYDKLRDKTKRVTEPFQLEIIGDMSKGIYTHVPEDSKYKEYAWRKHIEIDGEIEKAKTKFRTQVKKHLGGEVSTEKVGVSAGIETNRMPVQDSSEDQAAPSDSP